MQDLDLAFREVARVLRPGGRLVATCPMAFGQLREAGFSDAQIHRETSWKHGVLGSDLPGVLVIEAQR